MKLRNILSILFSMSILAACSSENDTINGDINAALDSNSSKSAAIAMKVMLNNSLTTKATESVVVGGDTTIAATETISKVSMLLINNEGTVIAAKDGVTLDATTGITNETFVVKSQTGLKVAIIANSSVAFASCKTLSEVNAKVQGSADLASFVKYGIADVNITKEYVSPTDAYNNPNTVDVAVQQLAASVVLDAFTVTDESFGTTNPKNVTVNKVTLLNIHNNCKTILDSDNSGSNVATGDANTSSTPKVLNLPVFTYDKATNTKTSSPLTEGNGYFFTFPSVDTQDASAVAMQVDYTVGDQSFSKVYKIKHDTNTIGVRSGYLYKLKMNMTLKSDEIYFKVTCYTLDWNYNQLSVNLEEI